MTEITGRAAEAPVERMFPDRWSPRAFTDEALPPDVLDTFFEAARWAPSAFNAQPWRFLYALRGDEQWELFLGLLAEFNRIWAQRAAALVFVVSQGNFRMPGSDRDTPSYSHSFDAGAAWANFALQASLSGWAAHGMTGFDHAGAPAALNIPEGDRVELAVAVGRRGDPALLPDKLRAREAPSGRLPLARIRRSGPFGAD